MKITQLTMRSGYLSLIRKLSDFRCSSSNSCLNFIACVVWLLKEKRDYLLPAFPVSFVHIVSVRDCTFFLGIKRNIVALGLPDTL
jgi:hypothetical protein